MMAARLAQEAAAGWGLYDVTRAHHSNSAIARVSLLWLHLKLRSVADLRQFMDQSDHSCAGKFSAGTQATVSFRLTTLSSTYCTTNFRVSRR